MAYAGVKSWVTGGSRGIGRAIFSHVGSCRCALALCGRDPDTLEYATGELIRDYGVSVYTRALDVIQPDLLEHFVADAAERFGALDGLVVNAGGSFGGDLVSSSSREWHATWGLERCTG